MKTDTPTNPSTQLPFHEAANAFELMKGAEFDELVADIKRHGLREPIVTYDDKIIDGRNRQRACEKAGVKPRYKPFQGEAKDVVPFIISANVHRRHLTAAQKDNALARLIKLNPTKSNRQQAKAVGVSHTHVAKVRAKLEKKGDVATVATSVDTKGRKQPAKKKRRTPDDFVRESKAKKAASEPKSVSVKITEPPETPPAKLNIPTKTTTVTIMPPNAIGDSETKALRAFFVFTITNISSGDLKISGNPECYRKWRELKDRAAPFVGGAS